MKFVGVVLVIAASLCAGCSPSGEMLQQKYMKMARTSLRQGAYERALAALNQMPATSPLSKEFYLIQGLAYFKMREFHHAMDAFERAAPSSPDLKRDLGYVYLFLGEVEAATSVLKGLRIEAGAPLPSALLRGYIALHKRAFAASRAAFTEAVTNAEQPAQAYIGLGNVALFERDMTTAEQHYLSALLVAPEQIHGYLVLSKFYMLMSRYDEAEANLRIALIKFPNHINTVILLGNLMIVQERCADALSLFRANRHLLATSSVVNLQMLRCMLQEKELQQAADIIASFQSKNSRKTLLMSGELHLRRGDVDRALSDFYRIAATQDDFIVDYYLGVVYLLRGETDLALSYLVKSLQKNPQHIQSNLLIAVIYLLQHDAATALKYATWATQLAPDNVQAYTLQGLSLYAEKRIDAALQAFDTVTELSPDNPVPDFFKALTAIRRQVPVAEDRVSELVSGIRKTYLDHVFLNVGASEADWHTDPHLMRQFVADLSAHLKASPSLLGALLLAESYQRMGAFELAEGVIQEALALREDCALCYYQLAYVAHLRHDRARAITLLERALALNPQLLAGHQAWAVYMNKPGTTRTR